MTRWEFVEMSEILGRDSSAAGLGKIPIQPIGSLLPRVRGTRGRIWRLSAQDALVAQLMPDPGVAQLG